MGETVTETFTSSNVILTQGFQQPFSFYLQQILNIPAGWSGVSGYSDPLNKSVEAIFAPSLNDFIVLASMDGVYFPLENINTLGSLHPGKAYFVRTSGAVEVAFGGCEKGEVKRVGGENLTDTGVLLGLARLFDLTTVTPTPSSHTIAILPHALREIEPGNLVGILNGTF